LEQVLAGGPLCLGRLLVIITELPLHHAVKATDLLLLAQLDSIVGHPTPAVPDLTGDLLQIALGI
jgi:hypothetical protein